jgi:hypothetical protein
MLGGAYTWQYWIARGKSGLSKSNSKVLAGQNFLFFFFGFTPTMQELEEEFICFLLIIQRSSTRTKLAKINRA